MAIGAKQSNKGQGPFSRRSARSRQIRVLAIALAAALATTTLIALPSGPAAASSAGDYCADTSPAAVDPEFFDGGDGLSTATAFEVSTATQLAGIAADEYCLNKFFKLTKSISLSELVWSPIGTNTAPFIGEFDGQGCTISDLTVAGPSPRRGLFGQTQSASIQHLKLENASVEGVGEVGLLVGNATDTQLSEISVSGTIAALGDGDSYDGAAGVVGVAQGGAFEYLTSSAKVNFDLYGTGGLVGSMSGTVLRKSFTDATAVVNGFGSVGGLVGDAKAGASVADSYAMGSVTGPGNGVGGLVGNVFGLYDGQVSMTNSYALAHVTGQDNPVDNSYSGGLVGSGSDPDVIGYAPFISAASFWDATVVGQPTTWTNFNGGSDETRKTNVGASTTAQMKTASTFEAWSSSIWNIADGSYPTLKDFDAQFGTCPGDDSTPVTPETPVVPGGGSAPAPTASATRTPSPSKTPVAPASLDPIPNNENPNIPAAGLRPGVSVVLVNGVPVPVTVAPDSNSAPKAIEIVGPGFTMSLSGRNNNADPLGLTKDAALILQSQQSNRSRSGALRTAQPSALQFKPCRAGSPEAATSGSGFKPESPVKFYLLPSTFLGEVTADASGAFSGAVPIPAGITLGNHTLQVNGFSTEGQVRSVSLGVIVEPAVAAKGVEARTRVFFDPLSASITKSGASALNALLAKTGKKGIKTLAVGFVQRSATDTNDQTLSMMRARNVAAYLRRRGLAGTYVANGDGVSAIASDSALARRVNVTITYLRPC